MRHILQLRIEEDSFIDPAGNCIATYSASLEGTPICENLSWEQAANKVTQTVRDVFDGKEEPYED